MRADVEVGRLVAKDKLCRDCGEMFALTEAEMHYPHEPARCQLCRKVRREPKK